MKKFSVVRHAILIALAARDSASFVDGKGSVDRKVTLQNGNLVIEGRQAMRINFEIRGLVVADIVRVEDIESNNTIHSTKIAQARIAYGGRG